MINYCFHELFIVYIHSFNNYNFLPIIKMPKFESLSTRVLVALIAIPVILWLTMLGGYYFFFLITVISSLTLYEFYGLAEAKGAAPLKTLGLIAGVIINAVFVYERFQVDIYQFVLNHFNIHLSMFSQHQLLTVFC